MKRMADGTAKLVNHEDMQRNTQYLDIGLGCQAGGHKVVEPFAGQPVRVGGHAVDNLNDILRQGGDRVMFTYYHGRRQSLFSVSAELTVQRLANFLGHINALLAGKPITGIGQPIPIASMPLRVSRGNI